MSSEVVRSPNRRHDREMFYKYVSAATAKAILRTRTLRWSSPTCFNDPFDVPRELSFGLTPKQIVEACAQHMSDLIESPPRDTSELLPQIRLILEAVRSGVSAELKGELLQGLKLSAAEQNPTGESMDAMRAKWRAELDDFRILCLTESPSHMAMWYHYADRYRGVALGFRCVDALDSAWLTARPMVYAAEKPEVYTAIGWARLLALRTDVAVRRLLDISTYTKAADWSYEHEWRVLSFKRPADTGSFTDYGFNPPELAEVYVGPLIGPDDEREVKKLVATYPEAQALRASVGMDRQLCFTRI